MDVYLRIDINIIAMVLLGIALFIAGMRLDRKDTINKTYLNVSRIIILELFLESVTCVINRRAELWLAPVSVALHICLFITGAVLAYYWFIFIRSMVTNGSPVKSKWQILLVVPVAVNAGLSLLSAVFPLLFHIDGDNVYHRGPLFIVSAAIIYFYLLLGFALIIKNRRKIIRQDFLPLCFLGILPTLGGVIQIIFYGTLLMWSCTAFSLIIVYIFLEERMVHLDYLTGAWTRHSFNHFVSQRTKQSLDDKFGIIYVDIDGLKRINDEYGHAEGDNALKAVTKIIKSTIRRNDVVARLGGDEFAVVISIEDGSPKTLNQAVGRIEAALMVLNHESGKPYSLQCSFGADIFNPDSCSLEQFMHRIDSMMYKSKRLKITEMTKDANFDDF